MSLEKMFDPKTTFFDVDLKSKDEALKWLSEKFFKAGIIKDEKTFLTALQNREKQDSTGIGEGLAIPHALNKTVKRSTVGFVRLKKPINWDSLDGQPIDLIFLIATNGEDGNEHLAALSELSKYMMRKSAVEGFRSVKTFDDFIKIFAPEEETKPAEEKPADTSAEKKGYDLVGITACPTGIAHTYMAEEKLIEAAKEKGMTVKIETQGRRGVEHRLTEDDIKNAKMIILGHDKDLEGMDRFNGMKVLDTSTQDVIYHVDDLIDNYAKKDLKTIKAAKSKDDSVGDLSLKKFKDFKGVLLAGVSKMLPFVVGGGIIMGLAFLLDFAIAGGDPQSVASANGGMGNFGTFSTTAGWFAGLGKVAMNMMVPILAAYIAYALVGAQGLMPGFVGGLLANNDSFVYSKGVQQGWANLWGRLLPDNIETNSGFIGGIAAAFLAGILVFGLTKAFQNFSKGFTGVRDIVLIPLLSLLGVGLGMFAINIPLGYVMWGIRWLLIEMAKYHLLVLAGLILGVMVCVDMGGPVNKIAYIVGTLSIVDAANGGFMNMNSDGFNENSPLMAAVMLSGMMPPLAIAFSTQVFKNAWTSKQRDAAKANWVMGISFVTEGAIPFMIDDYKRVNVSSMIGGGIVGILATALQIGIPAPHGGIFVSPLATSGLFTNAGASRGFGIAMYIILPFVGMAIAGTIMGLWRSHDIKNGKLVLDGTKAANVKVAKARA